MSEWDFLKDVAEELDAKGIHDLPHGIIATIGDRVIETLYGAEKANLDQSQSELESFYLGRLAKAPRTAALASRGEGDAASPEAAAFSLGLIGLAQAIVARVTSKRVDDRFERLLLSKQLERYVRLLIDNELSGRELADALGKDEAEVSRRLKMLRQIGAVDCRREANRIVNFLTAPARTVARTHNMGRIGKPISAAPLLPEVDMTLNDYRREYSPELRHALSFGGAEVRRVR